MAGFNLPGHGFGFAAAGVRRRAAAGKGAAAGFDGGCNAGNHAGS